MGGHIRERASELLDGRLTGSEEQRVREHLGRCRECAAHVADERDTRSSLRKVDQQSMPANLLGTLLAMAPPTQTAGTQPPAPQTPAIRVPAGLGSRAPLGTSAMLGDSNVLGSGRPVAEESAPTTGRGPRGPRLRGTLLVTSVLVSATTAAAGVSATSGVVAARRVVQSGAQLQFVANAAHFASARLHQALIP